MSDLRLDYLPLSKLKRASRNPKRHDLGIIFQSISPHGFVSPMLLNKATGKLLAGHGRLDALQQKKAQGQLPPGNIKVAGNEWLVPVIRGVSVANEADAEALLLADNRIVELGGWDDNELAQVLADLAAADALEGVGWDRDDVDALLKSLAFNADEVQFKEYDESVEEEVKWHECPHCGHKWPQ